MYHNGHGVRLLASPLLHSALLRKRLHAAEKTGYKVLAGIDLDAIKQAEQ